ncbi:hypothetical protein MAR_035433 [Mya arenaria]|uniref:Core-binding (CB) domain-containing protein n=1 Tax=Mya arenaria TaxID=6604 RepID=A0ABY7EK39_MYAAR|nr:hypothetical protein MAR_035433 [Mya arenaria]
MQKSPLLLYSMTLLVNLPSNMSRVVFVPATPSRVVFAQDSSRPHASSVPDIHHTTIPTHTESKKKLGPITCASAVEGVVTGARTENDLEVKARDINNTSDKGRLKQNVAYWKSIGASEFVLNDIENGYVIPFIETPFDSSDFKANFEIEEKRLSKLLNAKSKNTFKTYSSYFKAWGRFCDEHGLQTIPAQPHHIAIFLTSYADQNISLSKLNAMVYAIAWAHSIAGYQDPCKSSLVID